MKARIGGLKMFCAALFGRRGDFEFYAFVMVSEVEPWCDCPGIRSSVGWDEKIMLRERE